jgi:hypothetical protein
MGNLLGGLTLAILGFGIYQFSKLFSLYTAQAENEGAIPWPYIILRLISYIFMAIGIIVLITGFR